MTPPVSGTRSELSCRDRIKYAQCSYLGWFPGLPRGRVWVAGACT